MSNSLPRKLRVFLCHAKEDKNIVRELWNRLQSIIWIESWLDEENLLPGQTWPLEIYNAVSKADIVIVFLSKKSTTKHGFVQKEVRFAINAAEEKPLGSIFIIPVKLEEDCEVPIQISEYHCQNYFPEDYKSIAFDRLLTSFSYAVNELRERGENIVESVDGILVESIRREELINNSSFYITKQKKKQDGELSQNSIEKFRNYGWATCKNPGLLIYIVDVSESMDKALLNGGKRIDLVTNLLQNSFQNLISLSRDGSKIYPTYKIAIYAYAEMVVSAYKGELMPLDEVASIGIPQFEIMKESTDTSKAFIRVLNLLKSELKNMPDSPPPLICHITDGNYTGVDPTPYAKEIMDTGTNYGNTLLQHVFINENMLANPIDQLAKWDGIKYKKDLKHKYAKKLFEISSKLPLKYLGRLNEIGYSINPGTKLLFPGEAIDMVSKIYASPNHMIDCQ